MNSFILVLFFSIKVFSSSDIFDDNELLQKINEPKVKVSLVFVSQNLKSPISFFGHNLIIFHKQDPPELDSVVLEFYGVVGGSSANYMYAAFSTIEGRYSLTSFYEKQREYLYENRDFWIYRLDLSNDEKLRLINYVNVNSGKEFKYNFFTKNCAFYIKEAISESIDECHTLSHINIPIESIRDKCLLQRITSVVYLPSHQKKAIDSFERINKVEQQTVISVVEGKIDFNDTTKSLLMSNAISNVINFKIFNEAIPERRDWLYQLKKEVSSEISYQPIFEKVPSDLDPLRNAKESYIGMVKTSNGVSLTFSPVQRNFVSTKNDDLRSGYLDVAKTTLTLSGHGDLYLRELNLFSLDSIRPKTYFLEEFNSLLEVKYDDFGLSDNSQYFKMSEYTLRLGYGISRGGNFFDLGVIPFLELGSYQYKDTKVNINFGIRSRVSLFLDRSRFQFLSTNRFFKNSNYESYYDLQYLYQLNSSFNLGLGISGTNFNKTNGADVSINYLF